MILNIYIIFTLKILYTKSFEDIYKRAVDETPYQGYLLTKFKKIIPDIVDQYDNYKKKGNIVYSEKEDVYRFFIFAKELITITEHNQLNTTFTLGLNNLSTTSREEYFKLLGTQFVSRMLEENNDRHNETILDSVSTRQLRDLNRDWRSYNKIGPVRNQGYCGSCYSFATLSAVEAAVAIKFNKFVDYSEQFIVDCAKGTINKGCRGGSIIETFEFLKKYSSPTESEYPYIQKEQACRVHLDRSKPTIVDWKRINQFDEEHLSLVVSTTGPVTAAIDARPSTFKSYKSGIFYSDECSQTTLTHGVTLVGTFGTKTDREKYYIIRNSWGTMWGDNGYIKFEKFRNNLCGVATHASYPIV